MCLAGWARLICIIKFANKQLWQLSGFRFTTWCPSAFWVHPPVALQKFKSPTKKNGKWHVYSQQTSKSASCQALQPKKKTHRSNCRNSSSIISHIQFNWFSPAKISPYFHITLFKLRQFPTTTALQPFFGNFAQSFAQSCASPAVCGSHGRPFPQHLAGCCFWCTWPADCWQKAAAIGKKTDIGIHYLSKKKWVYVINRYL